MNGSDSFRDIDDSSPLDLMIQRCADGELSDADERSLLARLEFKPEGWRRLALSFVENRLLWTACRELVTNESTRVAPRQMPASAYRRMLSVQRWLMMSAAVLLAFFAGRGWNSGRQAGTSELAVNGVRAVDAPAPAATTVNQDQPLRPAEVVRNAPQQDGVRQPVMFVNLTLPGEERGVPVPVYSAPKDADGWQPFDRPAMTREQADWLRRAGYQVNTTQHLLQTASPDGDRILLPVEAVNIRPARF